MACLYNYKRLYLKDKEIRNLIVIDDYLSPWAVRKREKDKGKEFLETKDFERLFEVLHSKNPVQIARAMAISEERVPLVFISAVLIKYIAEMMGIQRIWVPGVTLCDGIAYEYAEKIRMFGGEHDFDEDIIACAVNISKRYMGNRKRSDALENFTTIIFDSMRRVHGLGKRERLYLRLAVILHECGKYISMVDIGETSFQIVMSTEIIGISRQEREIVANVVRFNHSRFVYDGIFSGGSQADSHSAACKQS